MIPCAKDENFAQTTLSPDGSRLVQLIRTDPPAEPRALEARLLDAATGRLVTSMAVSPTTYWVGFSGDSRGVYSFDGERLQRWSDKTGAAIGPGIDLSRYRVGESESPIPEDRLESMPVEIQQRVRSLLLSRSGLQIRGITAGGKAILFAKPRQRVVPPTEGSGRGARGLVRLPRGNSLYLLDLETETETLIPGSIVRAACPRWGIDRGAGHHFGPMNPVVHNLDCVPGTSHQESSERIGRSNLICNPSVGTCDLKSISKGATY